MRYKLIRNVCAVLFCSRGTPMFLAGDEFGNTQFGNNNPYCQDNEISWLNWDMTEKNRGTYDFFKYMIAFRKAHPVIRRVTEPCSFGFPDVSFHGEQPWNADYQYESRTVGVMFAGKKENGEDDIVYVAVNTFWGVRTFGLPRLPGAFRWVLAADTSVAENPAGQEAWGKAGPVPIGDALDLHPRSVVILTAEKNTARRASNNHGFS